MSAFSGVDHVGFTVSDLDRSVAWYTEFLGVGPSVRKRYDVDYIGRIVGYPGGRLEIAYFALPGGMILELLEYLEPRSGAIDMETSNAGNGHLCLITNDLPAEYERLQGKAAFRSPEPVAIEEGPYKGGAACYLRDPDGITIELLEEPPGGPAL
jgi:catechol 2,3-dioxygenase-like lactoylglutathione lyase family enzyme